MDLQAELNWIHKELDSLKNPTLILAIKNLLKSKDKISSDRITIEQYNEEINLSIGQIEDGQTYTEDQMKERMAQWIK